jgi:hypothetical protein
MESDLSTRTMGTELRSPLVERRSVCGYHTRGICDTGSTSLCHARRLASTGWGVWLPAWRVRLCLIWFLPPLGHWADFRDLAYGWGFRRATGHGRSGPLCSDCVSFSICSGRYVRRRMAIASEYSNQLHQRNGPARFQGWCGSEHRGNADSRSARHSRWWAQLH